MKNITVSVDEETHRQARIRAAELGTSVSALVRGYLRDLCAQPSQAIDPQTARPSDEGVRRRERLDRLLAEWKAKGIGLDPSENMTREEFYNEVMRVRGLLR